MYTPRRSGASPPVGVAGVLRCSLRPQHLHRRRDALHSGRGPQAHHAAARRQLCGLCPRRTRPPKRQRPGAPRQRLDRLPEVHLDELVGATVCAGLRPARRRRAAGHVHQGHSLRAGCLHTTSFLAYVERQVAGVWRAVRGMSGVAVPANVDAARLRLRVRAGAGDQHLPDAYHGRAHRGRHDRQLTLETRRARSPGRTPSARAGISRRSTCRRRRGCRRGSSPSLRSRPDPGDDLLPAG